MEAARGSIHDFVDDDEWEYEYDENETEDFFVTIDLTTHVKPDERRVFPGRQKAEALSSQARNARKPRGGKPGSRKHVKKPSKPQDDSEKDREAAQCDGEQEEADGQPPTTPENTRAQSQDALQTPAAIAETDTPTATTPAPLKKPPEPEKIQILDLHTHEPLICFHHRIYTCSWASSIGTDMIFSAPDTRHPKPGSLPEQPCEAEHLATTRHRLIARPVTLVPQTDTGSDNAINTKRSVQTAASGLSKAPSAAKARRSEQEDFLNRLSEARRQKGDDAWVPMHKNEMLVPKDIREMRAAAKAADQAEAARKAAERWAMVGEGTSNEGPIDAERPTQVASMIPSEGRREAATTVAGVENLAESPSHLETQGMSRDEQNLIDEEDVEGLAGGVDDGETQAESGANQAVLDQSEDKIDMSGV